ncbi:DNA-binding CsgD family transcriptional regulator [Hoeflea marina]|uniref:DNA-binding CsgD family transcriptional regulator n=1 Tax=Hoeflea marina TaxID=274592 RepID=A0A317PLK2_9HYPH|nr:helix-turn-helix transcriptional regulator [Hoeflea marina]PWV99916.1 DNA-binding CsgD family transcriptional regulator [Hoeflea marina]
MDRSWIAAAGGMIAAIGSDQFPPALSGMLRQVAAFDFTVIFGYRGSARPIDLYDDFPTGKRRIFVTDYQEGPYLLDPFFLASALPVKPGLYRMKDLAPDRFYQGEYFRTYYVRTGLAEEIGYFIDLPGSAMAVVSLMRAERPFTAREIAALDSVRPIVEAGIRGNWAELSATFSQVPEESGQSRIQSHIEHAFQTFGDAILTPREREVVEYTLKGHSAEAAGRIMSISSGTVRIHRRNIYAKLRIRSQGELFSRFIHTLMDNG